ncbi:MAG: hypothetical protein ACOX1P_19440 [Thermoguttaceae bacterium]|jgi:hypothetical protein
MTASIFMDGKLLTGTTWVRPTDYEDDDLMAGRLPYWKGSSPAELPELGPPTDDEDTPEHGASGRLCS